MPITIPPVPPEIIDPFDLYNDSYNWAPNARWNDPETWDRIAWLQETVPFEITGWAVPFSEAAGPGGTKHHGPTHMLVKLPDGRPYEVNMLGVCGFDPNVGRAEIYAAANRAAMPQLPPYPGFLVRNPVGGEDPVGEPWPEHPHNAKNRIVFRVSAVFTPEKWPYTVNPNTGRGTEFERPDGRYTLQRDYKQGTGMWGSGGSWIYRWNKDYSR